MSPVFLNSWISLVHSALGICLCTHVVYDFLCFSLPFQNPWRTCRRMKTRPVQDPPLQRDRKPPPHLYLGIEEPPEVRILAILWYIVWSLYTWNPEVVPINTSKMHTSCVGTLSTQEVPASLFDSVCLFWIPFSHCPVSNLLENLNGVLWTTQ